MPPFHQNYVVGLLVNRASQSILLVRKVRPPWQQGLYNGMGGRIEGSETRAEAVARECREESGLTIPSECWCPTVVQRGPDYTVYYLRADLPRDSRETLWTTGAEVPRWVPLALLHNYPLVPNLQWIIPLSLDPQPELTRVQVVFPIEVREVLVGSHSVAYRV